jgi:hypothetical protein
MPRQFAILISFRFGTQLWQNVFFPAAIGTIEKFLNAEQNSFVALKTQINTDQWIAAYWSEVFGAAEPPAESDWSAARIALGRARNAYDAGRDQEATQTLRQSVHAFNVVHRKFWAYREAVSKGGERAIKTMEITNMVLGAAFSAQVGIMGASIVGGAAASAGLTLAQLTAYNAMMVHIGAQQQFDVAEIVLQTAASFVSSLLSGKLCEKFATMIARRYFGSAAARAAVVKLYNTSGLPRMTFSEIAKWAQQARVALPLAHQMTSAQQFLAGWVASFSADRLLGVVTDVAKKNKGRLIRLEELMQEIAERVAMSMTPTPA